MHAKGPQCQNMKMHPPLISVLARLDARAARRVAPGWAQATHSANVTFVLFNDFYLMGEQPLPDGKSAADLPGSPPS